MHILRYAALIATLAIIGSAHPAFASDDRVSFGQSIIVSEGQAADDIVCILCSVTLRGDVHGNIVTILGGIRGEGTRNISGDVVAIGGDIALSESSRISGDLAVIGGGLELGPEAIVQGSHTVFPGRAWLLLPLAPILIVIGIAWLAIWLVRRNQYRFPMYPHGRGF